jgi:hypothetical protein
MFGFLFLGGLIAAVVALPLLLIGLVLRVVFRLVFLPFHILGALLGVGILGLILTVLGLAFGLVVGSLALVPLLVGALPVLLLGLAIWGLVRLLRGGRRHPQSMS